MQNPFADLIPGQQQAQPAPPPAAPQPITVGTPRPAQPPSGYQPAPGGFAPVPGGPADPGRPQAAPSGYRYDQGGNLVPIPGGPADQSRREPPAGFRWTQDGNLERIPGGPAEGNPRVGRDQVSNTLTTLGQGYMELNRRGAAISTDRSTLQNIGNRIAASGPGQLVGEAIGTESQSYRQQINNIRPLLLNNIRQASEMSARGMDSNKELEFYLQAATDTTRDLMSNLVAIHVLDTAYGAGTSLQSVIPPEMYQEVQRRAGTTMQERGTRISDEGGANVAAVLSQLEGGGGGGGSPDDDGRLVVNVVGGRRASSPQELAELFEAERQNNPDLTFDEFLRAYNAPREQPEEPEEPGIARQMLDAGINTVAGVGQGLAAIPDAAINATGAIASLPAEALGLDNVARDLRNPITIGGMIEDLAPTPDDTGGQVARFASQFAGGAASVPMRLQNALANRVAGSVPRAPPPNALMQPRQQAERVGNALRDERIPASRAIADPSRRGRLSYLETTQGGHGIVREGLDETRTALASRVDDLAGEGTARAGAMGEGIREGVTRNVANTRERASRLFQRASDAAADTPITPREALATLDENIVRLERNPRSNAGVLSYLRSVRQDLAQPGRTVADIREIRTGMSGEINRRNLGTSNAERLVNQALAGARRDIQRDLGSSNPQALRFYERGDDLWQRMATDRRQLLENLVGPADNPISGERVMDRVRAMMTNRGDAERFRRIMNSLTPAERADYRATVMSAIGREGDDGVFSAARFVTDTKNLSEGALTTLLGREGAQSVRNLRLAARGLTATERSLNNSRSGFVLARHLTSPILNIRSTIGGALGFALGGPVAGAAGGAAGAAAKFVGNRLSARALMDPDVSRWLPKIARANNPRAVRASINELRRIAGRNPAIAQELTGLHGALIRAANDDIPRVGQAVASPNERPERQ